MNDLLIIFRSDNIFLSFSKIYYFTCVLLASHVYFKLGFLTTQLIFIICLIVSRFIFYNFIGLSKKKNYNNMVKYINIISYNI